MTPVPMAPLPMPPASKTPVSKTPVPKTPVIEIEAVSVVFGDAPQKALPLMDRGADRAEVARETGQTLGVHDCSLTVNEGEILVLMGLSGSGKSTLLRAINGLNPVARGAVRLRDGAEMVEVTGADAATLRNLRRARVAMVFQQFGLLPWRSVTENVGLGLELAGVSEAARHARVAAELERVGLAGQGARRVAELSGGMQQRVGLARAFVTEAPILLLDEPFSALDPLIRARLQDDLLGLQRDLQRTMVFVSHDLDEAFKLGSRIALMEGGRLVQVGTAREIIAAPANAYVADFVAHMNPLSVLTARDVMVPGLAGEGTALPADLPVKEVMLRILQAEGPLPVVERDRPLGAVTREAVLARLMGAAA